MLLMKVERVSLVSLQGPALAAQLPGLHLEERGLSIPPALLAPLPLSTADWGYAIKNRGKASTAMALS